jgi:hypothetical protein
MHFPLAFILFFFSIVFQQSPALSVTVSPAKQIEAIINPYLKTVNKDDRKLFLENLRIFLFNGYNIIEKTDGDGEILVDDKDLIPFGEEQTLVKHLQYVVRGLKPPEKSSFKNYFQLTVERRSKVLASARPGSPAYTSKIKQTMKDLRQAFDAIELPPDPVALRIEAIVNPYLKSEQDLEQRKLFIEELESFLLDEYNIISESLWERHRPNGRIKVQVAKQGRVPIDQERTLVDHLEYVVKGIMSKNPADVTLWKQYFTEEVKQREEILRASPPGSKAFADKAKVMIQEIRQEMDIFNSNRKEGQNGIEALPEL